MEGCRNDGSGINQWGNSGDYEGADLMQLLNGYYIGVENSTCTYCDSYNQETCEQICTVESLTNANMKPLTSIAKEMIENAVWDTYATNTKDLPNVYLQEKGISSQYTGRMCESFEDEYYGVTDCNDNVIRTTKWTGLVGLMSLSDMIYSGGWTSYLSKTSSSYNPWTITAENSSDHSSLVWVWDSHASTSGSHVIYPSVYLKSGVKVVSGNGDTEPYILK